MIKPVPGSPLLPFAGRTVIKIAKIFPRHKTDLDIVTLHDLIPLQASHAVISHKQKSFVIDHFPVAVFRKQADQVP